jgi:hypothetical protein
MGDAALRFWQQVNQEEAKIRDLILSGGAPHQPRPAKVLVGNQTQEVIECVFLTSIRNLLLEGHVEGRTVSVILRTAAQKIVENSHRLATSVEIEQWAKDGRDRLTFYQSEDSKRKRAFRIELPDTPAPGGSL